MADFELDLNNVSEDSFRTALANYNGKHSVEFALTGSNGTYNLAVGSDSFCSGSLDQVAHYWEGFVSGQMEGDTSLALDLTNE